MSIDLTNRAELLEVIAVLVDALRRSDPEYCDAHGVEQCSEDEWDTAIQAGEDALEANDMHVVVGDRAEKRS